MTTAGPTAAADATLHFDTVPRTILPGMEVADLSNGAAIPTRTVVVSTTATTALISQSATGTGIRRGETIQFSDELMTLPDADRFLVVRVDATAADGTLQAVFVRKMVPSLECRAGGLMLYFPTQVVARRNLNNVGNFGTNIVGGVASL